MNAIVFKCNVCKMGPCYFQCDKSFQSGFYGDDCIVEPTDCPHCSQIPAWKELTHKEKLNYTLCEALAEWLSGEGWDKTPEEIREEVMCAGIVLRGNLDADKARRAFGLLCAYDRYEYSFEEMKKTIEKLKKMEIVAGLLPEAFRAGIVWREKYLQEHGK